MWLKLTRQVKNEEFAVELPFKIRARATRNKSVRTLSSNTHMWQVICGNNMFVFNEDGERRDRGKKK